jgi:hypothetical protein
LELANDESLRILIVDSDTENSLLSQRLNVLTQAPGVTDYFRGEAALTDLILPTDCPNSRFLSRGKRPLDFTRVKNAFETSGGRLLQFIRGHFDFMLVTCGSAFDRSISFWGTFCDVSYLTINPMISSRSLAKAAVGELQKAGARVGGCITSYAKPGEQAASQTGGR